MRQLHPLLALPLAFVACTGPGEDPSARADLTKVTRGEMIISVTESGDIKAAVSTRVKNDMEGNSTIIQLIEEGTIVKKGDLLVELDASSQIERRATQEIAVEKAIAAVVNAKKSLEILRKQTDSEKRAAFNTWEFAKMDKRKFYGELLESGKREMGEQEQSIKAEEAEIALAKSELKLAQDRFNWSVKLKAKDFITQDDLDRDRLDFDSKQTRLTLAINKLAILKKYTHAKTKAELDQAELDAKLEHERTIAKGEAEITQAVADLNAKIKEDELASERLKNLVKQIKSAKVLAPTPGIVVYASEGDRWRRRTVEIGAQVRERQSLIILPDTTVMHAELKIQEVMIDSIRPGLPAEIRIDTSPEPLRGVVLRRAPLPDSGSRMGNPDLKEYKTTVKIHGNNEGQLLRPNMSATVEIFIDRLENILSVKQQAVNSQGAINYVWLFTENGPVTQIVKTGPHNEAEVIIKEGLEEGQLVYLVEPAGSKAPVFKQPESKKQELEFAEASLLKTSNKTGGDAPDRGPGNGERTKGGGDGQGDRTAAMATWREASATLKAAVKDNNPELFKRIEEAGMRWAFDQDIKVDLQADSSLNEAYAAYEAAMAKMRGGRNRGRGGEGGRNRGGEGGRNRGGEGERGRGGESSRNRERRGGDGNKSGARK